MTTDEAGIYRALLLRPDTYEVRAVSSGLASNPRIVELTVGETAVLDFALHVPAFAGGEIVVASETGSAEPERTQQSNTINGEILRQLPIDKRNYLTYSLLMPGVADAVSMADANDYRPLQAAHSGISFYGNNGRGNAVSVDGGEANDSGGGVRPTLSQDAVQEFQINRSNYSAELGGSSGGTINIVSRSGTDSVHGSIYGFFRNHVLDAADPFAAVFKNGTLSRIKPPAERQQFGATLGGPLKASRTFFLGAFEGLHRDESKSVSVLTDETIFSPTPQQEAILTTLPSPLATELRQALISSPQTRSLFRANSGVFPYRGSEYKFSLRVDHSWDSGSQILFRYNGATVDEANPNLRALVGSSRATNTSRLDHTGIAKWTKTISSRTMNEFHYQFNYGKFLVNPVEKFGPEININGFGYFNRDAFLPSRQFWRRHQLVEKWSSSRGPHLVKVGAELLVRSNSSDAQLFFPGRFNFGMLPGGFIHPALSSSTITAVQAFNLGLAQSYQQGFGDSTVSSTEPFVAGSIQDHWRVLKDLTLDVGSRYELDVLHAPIRTDFNNLAPRVAFAWDVRGTHRTTVRGGWGIFFAPTNYAVIHVTNALGEIDGRRQITQILTSIGPGKQNAANIYQTLVRQSVITLPTPVRSVAPDDLTQFGINVDSGQRPPLSVRFGNSPDFASAYTEQASVGIQHVFGSDLMMSANYVFVAGLRIARARDQNLLPIEVNPALGLRAWSLTTRDPSLFRDITLVQDNVYESTGRSFYHGLTLEMKKRFSSRIHVNANYTLSKAIDDVVDFNSDFQANDQLNLRAERALSSFDQRHKIVAYASFDGPARLTVTPVFRLNTGRPFNLLVGSDLNEDFHSTTDRPPFAGRNTGKGPTFWTADLRVTRHVPLRESAGVDLVVEVFNAFNQLNFKSVNNTVGMMPPPFDVRGRGDIGPSQPLAFTSAFDPRQVQVGARFSF